MLQLYRPRRVSAHGARLASRASAVDGPHVKAARELDLRLRVTPAVALMTIPQLLNLWVSYWPRGTADGTRCLRGFLASAGIGTKGSSGAVRTGASHLAHGAAVGPTGARRTVGQQPHLRTPYPARSPRPGGCGLAPPMHGLVKHKRARPSRCTQSISPASDSTRDATLSQVSSNVCSSACSATALQTDS